MRNHCQRNCCSCCRSCAPQIQTICTCARYVDVPMSIYNGSGYTELECCQDTLEVLQPDGSVVPLTPAWIKDEEGKNVDATPHPLMHYTIPCETPLMPYSLLRMQKTEQ